MGTDWRAAKASIRYRNIATANFVVTVDTVNPFDL